jgi:hypothetical protein
MQIRQLGLLLLLLYSPRQTLISVRACSSCCHQDFWRQFSRGFRTSSITRCASRSFPLAAKNKSLSFFSQNRDIAQEGLRKWLRGWVRNATAEFGGALQFALSLSLSLSLSLFLFLWLSPSLLLQFYSKIKGFHLKTSAAA